ncbi:MAG: Tfp pilus assembly protein FimT/FimU [Micropepsaceae bacterium]
MARGYSLLEVLVVLAIMGLIAAVAAPLVVGSIDRVTLNTDAREVATRIRALRETALDTQNEVAVGPGDLELSPGTEIGFPKGGITVAADGTAGGTLRLTRGSASVRVVVNRLTGRIVVEGQP